MSYIKNDFNCPNCKEKNRIKMYQTLDESNVDDIIKGKIFDFTCKSCGEHIMLAYNVDYITDQVHIFFRPNKEEVKEKHELSRICYTYEDFKEKVMILNDNLNDILICFIKCFLMDMLPLEDKSKVNDIRYNGKDDEVLAFYLFGLNKYVSFNISSYEALLNKSKFKKTKKTVLIDNMTFRKYFRLR